MDRRKFLAASVVSSAAPLAFRSAVNPQEAIQQKAAQQQSVRPDYSDYSKDPRPDIAEGTCTAGSLDGPVFKGYPVVSGPSPDAISVLQPLQRMATGHLEYSIEGGPWQRVDNDRAGQLPLSKHVLKYQLPKLPAGKTIAYRVIAHSIGWTKVRQFYHGVVNFGAPQTSEEYRFRTLDPDAETTKFAVWNDTHENDETITALQRLTRSLVPDFLLWNGDQSNDCHFEEDMAGQFLNPSGLSIATSWPMAYVRGNHECRGPATRSLPDFTGSPGNQFYYGFRSGPVAALVMDTGEDKPDDHPSFGGMANYASMQREQAKWLEGVVEQNWFRSAPFKLLFCHIPLWFNSRNGSFDGHRLCRKLWSPVLIKSRVDLVISGHTHRFAWMPKSDSQAISQLVGGAPQHSHATLIAGTANERELKITVSKLDGTEIQRILLPANNN